ncbi:PREDICTED: deoxyhypusine hydroxylase-like [Acropora digitifera]|uniref:deoxyhypusine hydroxylase-like n=1 Tax=Acropora digitifera TaxID=70779 RepID=UPI00077A02A8|nr:PREDICTED: deoxyhypusine hydroxylase-like [Acropora digitifera]
MVRHEAGEALGAIGSPEVLNVLKEYASDPQIEVAETCHLALQRIEWLNEKSSQESKNLSTNPYKSIDPAPPSQTEDTETLKNILLDESRPLFERYRAMFSLRNKGDEDSVLALADGLKCRSALFRHEIAYVLGQMQHEAAIPQLIENLEDLKESAMVRHECAEALGSIAKVSFQDTNPYESIDPAPPSQTEDTETLKNILLDESCPLFERYRAMFSLRNKGDEDSVLALADGLKCRSALFRHEIAYVLGQMQHEAAIPQLIENLEDLKESAMVRHECAEALGSIAKDQCLTALEKYSKDQERVVKESCVVALDMYNYEQSKDFQYADSLVKMKET